MLALEINKINGVIYFHSVTLLTSLDGTRYGVLMDLMFFLQNEIISKVDCFIKTTKIGFSDGKVAVSF